VEDVGSIKDELEDEDGLSQFDVGVRKVHFDWFHPARVRFREGCSEEVDHSEQVHHARVPIDDVFLD
jgi:hypothetical protein